MLNMSTAETADSLRIAEGTVRSRLSRAVAVLRRDLNEGEL
jgi:RNA polymerase sigma-70 factor (ECF subfamily)